MSIFSTYKVRGLSIPVPHFTAGNVFFVDSGSGNDVPEQGSNPNLPFATIDYAVGKCTASNGDVIYAMPGHVETVTAAAGLDLDVAGITIVFLGNDNDRARVNFTTAVSADMDVDAADITLVNPRFTAGIDALTGPIDVNAARFKIINGLWEDGTTIDTTDCIVADANADDLIIDGWTYRAGDEAGTQKQSQIQIAGATRPKLSNIRATGDFGTGIIENGTAWIDATLENLVLDNSSASPTVCILLQATSTGWARNSSLRVASGTTGYTANNDMQFDNVNVTGTDAATAQNAVVGGLADSAATGAVTSTDTIMAYIKQLVTQNGTELDTDTLGAILVGSDGIATWPAAAAPGNAVSIAEAMRYVSEKQSTRIVSKAYADLTGFDTAAAFTVTGDVLVNVWGVVGSTGITSTSGTTTLSVGTTEAAQAIIANSTVNNTQFAATDVWVDSSPSDDAESLAERRVVVGGGADIILTRSADDLTAGSLTLYCEWKPLSSDGAIVAA